MSYPGQGQWGPPQGQQWQGPPPEQGQWQQPGPPQGQQGWQQQPAQGPPPGQGGGWPQQGGPQQGQWGQPAQGYAGPQQGGWPQQGGQQQGWQGQPPQQGQWGQQGGQQQAAPVVKGTLGAFYSQPTVGGGPALKFPAVGTEHYMIISRTVTNADVEQQTGIGANANQLLTHKDGSPKWVMKIPGNTRQSPDYQDGKVQWYCQGAARDLLNAKIAQSGAPVITEQTPDGPVQAYVPEPGSLVRVKLASKRKVNVAGMNDANVWEVDYWRPDQAQIAAPQLGIEYPTVAELAQVTAAEPAGAPTPTEFAPAGQGQAMGPNGAGQAGAPGNGQWGQQPQNGGQQPQNGGQPGQGWAQQPGGGQQQGAPGGWSQQPQNGAQQPAGPPQGASVGAPPAMDWQAAQGGQQSANAGYIPPATNQPQAGPPPGMDPGTQQLQGQLTGRQ